MPALKEEVDESDIYLRRMRCTRYLLRLSGHPPKCAYEKTVKVNQSEFLLNLRHQLLKCAYKMPTSNGKRTVPREFFARPRAQECAVGGCSASPSGQFPFLATSGVGMLQRMHNERVVILLGFCTQSCWRNIVLSREGKITSNARPGGLPFFPSQVEGSLLQVE